MNGLEAMTNQSPEKRRLTVRTSLDGNGTVEIAVTDSGHGIEPAKLARLFEPFFTTKPNGMGMGLSIARRIVEAHRGRITAENNASGGATFRVTLPVTTEESKP
jgi:signal transduction histidine kinase